MKNSLRIAFCGIITALSVVFMFMGGVLVIFNYIMPMLAGVLMLITKKTFGTSSAWITYISTSALSLMLVADKECMLMYILFFGFYPIIKSGLGNISNRLLRMAVKLMLFNALMSAAQLILVYVFNIPFIEDDLTIAFVLLFIVLLNILFVTYDLLLDKIFIIYGIKLEPKIKKYFKK